MKQLESKSVVLLHHHLKALRLPTIGAECEKLAHRAAADNVDHLTYLLQICELELLERERKAAECRLKAARFPMVKSLESFEFTARPSAAACHQPRVPLSMPSGAIASQITNGVPSRPSRIVCAARRVTHNP